jgi:hypothetical protein
MILDVAAIKTLIRSTTSRYRRILKWDRNQPRGAKGTPEGGRWVAGVSQGTEGVTQKPSFTERLADRAAQGNYADILNAPTGTGFGNAPRLTGDPGMVARLTPPPAPPKNKILDTLKTAGIADFDEIGAGEHANAVFKVTLDDAKNTAAALKPEHGETWTGSFSNGDINDYVTNREFSLAEREAMAYEFSEIAGLHIVPETVHRTEIANLPTTSGGGGNYMDPDDIQAEYEAYKEKALEKAMDAVGEEFGNLYYDAQTEHLEDINRRADEAAEIWNDLVEKEFPDTVDVEAQREHPALPMGSQQPFERREPVVLDPLELMDEAKVDVTHTLNEEERENLRAVMRKHLEDGASELGDVDEDAAREHLDRDQWMEDHQDTENRMYESKIQSLESWKQSQGYDSGGGSGSGDVKNDDAPHPNGGVLQKWVPGLRTYGHPSAEEERKLAVFDYAVGTMDRHGSNMFFDGEGNMLAMDNGYAFPDATRFTFRTDVVRNWRTGGNTVMPEAERKALSQTFQSTDWEAFADRHLSMSQGEREAFLGRINDLKGALRTSTGLMLLWKKQNIMW